MHEFQPMIRILTLNAMHNFQMDVVSVCDLLNPINCNGLATLSRSSTAAYYRNNMLHDPNGFMAFADRFGTSAPQR